MWELEGGWFNGGMLCLDIYIILRDLLNFNVMYIKVYKYVFVKIIVDLIFNYSLWILFFFFFIL